MTLTALMLLWIYLQTPSLWSLPILPYHSLLSLYQQALIAPPYWAGFLLNLWSTTVVSVVLYTTSSSLSTSSTSSSSTNILHSSSIRSSSPLPHSSSSSPLLSSLRSPSLTSLCSRLTPHLTTLLFVWIVYSSILLSSLLSFFSSPEYQSFSYATSSADICSHSFPFPSSADAAALNSSTFLTFPRYQSGPLVSELLYHPCERDPSVLIAIRRYHGRPQSHRAETRSAARMRSGVRGKGKGEGVEEDKEGDLEIEILSRVSLGNDLLLRVELRHWEDSYRKSISHDLQQPTSPSLRYESISSDGWWVSYSLLSSLALFLTSYGLISAGNESRI
jgi:hypothetical protein